MGNRTRPHVLVAYFHGPMGGFPNFHFFSLAEFLIPLFFTPCGVHQVWLVIRRRGLQVGGLNQGIVGQSPTPQNDPPINIFRQNLSKRTFLMTVHMKTVKNWIWGGGRFVAE